MELKTVEKIGRYIDPFHDFSFKHLFGTETNKEILIEFLSALFEGQKEIVNINYCPTEYSGDDKNSKKVNFDLMCTTQDGEYFILEMQRKEQKYFRDRCIYYVSRIINQQVSRGGKSNWNEKLKGVYLIGFLDFCFKDGTKTKYVNDYSIINTETGNIFHNKLGFKFLELPNFTKPEIEITSELDKWIYLLKNMHQLDNIPDFLNKPVFQQIFKLAEISNLTNQERMMYESNLKNEWDYENTINFAAEQARIEEKNSTAYKLKKEGIPLDQIIRVTGLTLEEIENLPNYTENS